MYLMKKITVRNTLIAWTDTSQKAALFLITNEYIALISSNLQPLMLMIIAAPLSRSVTTKHFEEFQAL